MEDMARLAVVEQGLKDVDKFNNVLYELLRHITNILDNPHDDELRTLKSDKLNDVLNCKAFNAYLTYVGFRREGTKFIYPKEFALSGLRMAQAAIERKICFCYGPLNRKMTLNPVSSHTQTKMKLKPVSIPATTNPLLLKIQMLFNRVLEYEDEELLELAREKIPIVTLQLKALDRVREQQKLIKTGEIKAQDLPFDVALLMELMAWFKYKFFAWVDKPTCESCGFETTFFDTATVIRESDTCQVEVYKCDYCDEDTSFVRYNKARTLLRTRRGRCGEWANCFALLCRAMGYDTRFVYDTTDHVWCEIFDYDSNTWLHVDPCEGKLNSPLLYAHGWGKKLSYVIAVSRDDVQDVTWRYTMDHKEVLARRKSCTEDELLSFMLALREQRQRDVSEARKKHLARRTLQELATLMQERKPTDYENHGRISGDLQWRADRGEVGTDAASEGGSDEGGHSFVLPRLGAYSLRYFASFDYYTLVLDGQEVQRISTWAAGTCQSVNIFRKVEHDWKKVYLAREEGTDVGSLTWRVSAGEGLRMTSMRLRVHVQEYSSGKVAWTVQYDNKEPEALDYDAQAFLFGVRLQRSCLSLVVRVELSGGTGDVAWQHAQVCREQIGLGLPSFELTARLIPDV